MARATGTQKKSEKGEAQGPKLPPETSPAGLVIGCHVGEPAEFGRNMARVAGKSQRILFDFMQRQAGRSPFQPLDPLNISGAFYALMQNMAANPGQILDAQFALWKD